MQNLKEYNTFGIEAFAQKFYRIQSIKDLEDFTFSSTDEYFILGGGSNMLITRDIEVTVLKNEIMGRRQVQQSVDHTWVQLGGGENWHEVVLWSLDQKLSGLENLSLIPGTVGACPIQNIGAYGVEVKDIITQVTCYDVLKQEIRTFSNDECEFAYRNSFFKQAENTGRYFITQVTFKLSKDFKDINTSYGIIQSVLDQKSIVSPNAKDVSNAVIEIRQSKLPDPAIIGNSGSFFKNPIVEKSVLDTIEEKYENVPHYPIDDDHIKIPAGWLIEKCGWKGKRVGNTGNYENQALIIVNHGGATGDEVFQHAKNVRQSVLDSFGIDLDFEVNIV